MGTAQIGNTVKVHYTGKLDGGEVFDSSAGRDPLEFKIGSGNLIEGFEKGVIGMGVGDTKAITITPEEGYGKSLDELILTIGRENIPDDIPVQVGQQVQLSSSAGSPINAIMTEVSDESVTLDANHPLAGQTLFFDLELMEIA